MLKTVVIYIYELEFWLSSKCCAFMKNRELRQQARQLWHPDKVTFEGYPRASSAKVSASRPNKMDFWSTTENFIS